MLLAELQRWKELEVRTRRTVGQAAHPDDCPKLPIKGVEWAIPRRQAQIVPTFSEGAVSLDVISGDQWPEIDALIAAVAQYSTARRCSTCGQITSSHLEADLDDDTGLTLIGHAVAVAVKALSVQYAMSEDDLSALLSFEPSDFPEWFHPLLCWANGIPMDRARYVPTEDDGGPYDESECDEPEAVPVAARRAWWKRLLGRR